MNLYYITQNVRSGWDTYDGAVVAAKNIKDARTIHPSNFTDNNWWEEPQSPYSAWAHRLDQVEVELIGKAKRGVKRGVVVASFNAG